MNGAGDAKNHASEKHVSRLKQPTRRAKQALLSMLEKSLKHFQEKAESSKQEKEKSLFLKKKERISQDLAVLKVLSEDEIIRYSLAVSDKIMSIASNMRVPREERLKARVAAHKPLSTHLRRLRQKRSEPQDESESESDDKQDSCSSLNKITFNNTIVAMRKDVRRAKVHVIHKLTRNIQKLRAAKGNEEKVAKFKNKADRLHKKVVRIKELHEDEISKFALSTTQNVNQLAFDVKMPTVSQALATVAINKFVVPHVTNFKSKYPDWQNIVPNLLKKKSKKRKLNHETKDSKNASTNLSEENDENKTNDTDSGNENGSCSDSSENENEEEEEAVSGSENEVDEDSDRGDSDEDVNSSEEKDSSDSDSNLNTEHIVKIESTKIKKLNSSPKAEIKIQASKKNIKSDKLTKRKSPVSSEPLETKPVENKPKVVDPFFITTANEEYETSQVPLTVDNNTSNKRTDYFESGQHDKFINVDTKRKWERTKEVGNYGKSSRFQNSAPYPTRNPMNFHKNSAEPKTKIVFGNRKERRKVLHQPPVEEKVEKLHPSWEAKKKQSVIIPFQGKKVTFD